MKDGKLTIEEIRDRLTVRQIWIPVITGATIVPDPGERMQRNVVQLRFDPDAAAQRGITISKVEEDATETVKWDSIQVTQNLMVEITTNYHPENPIINIQGGSSLIADVTGNSISCTATYWDDDI